VLQYWQDFRSQTSSLAAELIVGRSRDLLYTPPKASTMFPLEEVDGSDPGVSRVKITPRQRMTADRGRLLAWALPSVGMGFDDVGDAAV
jgi:hypothetical protein